MDVSHLYAAVLLCSELLCADGSYRDVGLDLLGVLEEERQRVHAAERRADDHHGAGLQSLTHLSEEHTWSRLTHWSRGGAALDWPKPEGATAQTQTSRFMRTSLSER